MAYTDYPNGITSFGVPVMGSNQVPVTTGTYFFVDSGHSHAADSAGHGKTASRPYATIDYAIGKCTDSNGDVIIVAPGHAETLSTGGAITCDKIGVTIVGLGNGSNKPTLTFSATAATIVVSAANVTLSNFNIATGVAELVTAIHVTGADAIIEKMYFSDSSTYTFISAITAAATALRLNIRFNQAYTSVTPTGTAAFISLTGACNAYRITDNDLFLARANNAASAAIGTLTAAALGVQIHRNNLVAFGGANSLAISLYAATTGSVTYNNLAAPKTAIAGVNAIANCYGSQNFVCNSVALSGLLDPVADS